MRILLEMVHDHIDIEHIIASFLLISNFQLIRQNLIIPIVIHLIHQLHQLKPRRKIVTVTGLDPHLPQRLLGFYSEHLPSFVLNSKL